MLALDVERVMRLAPLEPAPPPVSPIFAQIGRAYADACLHAGAHREAELKSAVVTLAAQLRAEGVPPERTVIILKQAIANGDESHTFPSLAETVGVDDDLRRQRIYQLSLRWCLDAYYSQALQASTP